MDYKEHAVSATQKAYDMLYRTARAMTEEKLQWKPLDQGRSVIDQLQECARVPRWIAGVLRLRALPPTSEGERAKALEESKQWKTLDQLESVFRNHLEQLFSAIREFPEAELEKKITLPFGRGVERTLAEMMLLPQQNAIYHIGQINYIQTLYGDLEMH